MNARLLSFSLALVAFWSPSAASAQTCYMRPFSRIGDPWGCAASCDRTSPHRGTDFPVPEGTPIPAIADGIAHRPPWSSCIGNVVVIQHPDGMFSGYAHMSAISVGEGEAVVRGQTIGLVGHTGTCQTGPHLHMTMGTTYESYASGATIDGVAYIDSHSVCSCDRSGGPFTFSCDGVNAGAHCVSVNEPGDPDSWHDNFLCSARDEGFVFSADGPVDGMNCAAVNESADPHTSAWADDYACAPLDAAYTFEWGSAGAIAGTTCVNFNEPSDPGTWNDNFLCMRQVHCFHAGGFTFCGNGPEAGSTCVLVDEPSDPDTWNDNYFCSAEDIGMRWSFDRPIDGMDCVNVHESADPQAAAWADNYLCLPEGSEYAFTWSSAGPVEGQACVRWYEASDQHGTWYDNYLCVVHTPRPVDAGVDASAIGFDASTRADVDGAIVHRDAGGMSSGGAGPLRSGCSCTVGARPAPLPSLLGLGLLAIVLRRRREALVAARRAIVVALCLLLLAGCGSSPVARASVSGDAFAFNGGPEGRVPAARVFVLEDPSFEATTDAMGHFLIEGLPVGSDVTLVMEHPDYIPIQTGTHELTAAGIERLTFQAVSPEVRDALAGLLGITIDPTACQMVTTVTRVGRSLYEPNDHGEEGATVTIDPPLPAESGPIYFTEMVLPSRALTMTTNDGGVLFVNVPPGEYTWTAHEEGAEFTEVRMQCRPGMLVNASPPWGLQRL